MLTAIRNGLSDLDKVSRDIRDVKSSTSQFLSCDIKSQNLLIQCCSLIHAHKYCTNMYIHLCSAIAKMYVHVHAVENWPIRNYFISYRCLATNTIQEFLRLLLIHTCCMS